MKYGRWIRQIAPILSVAILGIAVSIAAWHQTVASEDRTAELEYARRSDNQANVLQSGIDEYWEKLFAVRALMDSSDQITREEFEYFANSLIAGRPAIFNVGWLPRVKRAERAAHEMEAARDGIGDYHIRTIVPDGSLPASPERDEYFPKFYSTEARTSRVYGLDLNDDGIRSQTIAHVRDNNVLSISPPIVLYTGQGDRRGFWAGLPVYARGLPHETLEDRRRNLRGIVQGVFQVGVMIDAIFAGVKSPARLYLFPADSTLSDLPIYYTSHLGKAVIEPKSQIELAGGLHKSFPLTFGDVQWTMVLTPEPLRLAPTVRDRSRVVLIFGLLLSAGLASFIWAMRRNGRKLQTAYNQLAASNAKYENKSTQFGAALNNMMQGLLLYDRDGKLAVFNRRFAKLFHVPWERWENAALGTTMPETMQLVHDLTGITQKNPEKTMAEHQAIMSRNETGAIMFELTDGSTFSAATTPVRGGGFVVTFEDITDRRAAEAKIRHMAHYDALTDLPNRTMFYDKMQELLARVPQGASFAVFSMDLDHFKSVNDTFGHQAGDELLQAVARRMRGCIRDTDIVTRLGGDEFAILQLILGQPKDTTALAARLIKAVSEPYHIDGHQIIVGISIGIAVAPGDGTDPNQLMKDADMALYRAKADGGSRCRFFETQMDASVQERHAIELDLRNALGNREFTLNYQPIVNLNSGNIAGCEALIRWDQPKRGRIPPLEFISIAEDTGLIVPIGEWVLRQACADATDWPNELTVAVNVSPIQFRNANFIPIVKDVLEKSGLPASRLEIEITELVLMQDDHAALAILRQLKDLGVGIAMDDFGTGYSSLSYLRSFPFDKIKIDQSFIRDLAKNEDSLAILRAVVGLGRSLRIVTTAEGVETLKQLEVLKAEGCTEAQGYYFSRPLSAADTLDMLNASDGRGKELARLTVVK